jgi:hypothetical protein
MTKRTFTDKNNNEWSFEETPEVLEALKQLHQTVKEINEKKFAGNYSGPLYAPHPDLKNETSSKS